MLEIAAMAFLHALSGDRVIRSIPILEPRFVVGRSPDCHLCDIFAGNETVSHHHACIDRVNDQFILSDTNSYNGTSINSREISEPTALQDGDVIAICKWKFRFGLSSKPDVGSGGDTKGVADQHSESSVESRLDVDEDGSSSTHNTTSAAIRLKALLGVLTALGNTLNIEELLGGLLAELLKVFPAADTGQVWLLSNSVESSRVSFNRIAVVHSDPNNPHSHLSKTIVAEVLKTKQAILYSDRDGNRIIQNSDSVRELGMRSAMCVPLLAEGEVLGVMQVDTRRPKNRFHKDDLEILAGIAPLMNLAIRHSQLHERLLRQRAMEFEMAAAQRVQLSLLPRQKPAIPGYEFFAHYHPALQVGGDYYDYIWLSDGRLAVVLADASGKGTSAALYMSAISGELKCSLYIEKTTDAALGRLNRWICDNPDSRFVTMAVIVLDPATHSATILNAGHFAPMLRRASGNVEGIGEEHKGVPLGVLRDEAYRSTTLQLAPGDSLIMFTDGFTDAESSQGERYEKTRLLEQVQAAAPGLVELGEQIVGHVREFMGSHPQYDDMCMTCLGRSLHAE
jgi:phosphoserine phosphatase RsbU/P